MERFHECDANKKIFLLKSEGFPDCTRFLVDFPSVHQCQLHNGNRRLWWLVSEFQL